jgi:Yip1-like protein
MRLFKEKLMAATAAVPQELAPLSQAQRVVNTFFAPSKTFTDLRRSAAWWAPFLISVIFSVAFVYVVDQKIGFRKVVENQLRLQPKQAERIEQLPANQRETAMQRQTSVTKGISYGFPLLLLAWHAIVAAVLLATLKFGASAEIKYKTLFALVIYAGLPGLFKAVLAVVSILAGVASDAFTFQNPVATNPGYFIDAASSPVLFSLLSSLDVLTIWTLVLAAIGITCVSKVKRGTAFAIVFGWYAVTVLFGVAIALAFA